MKALIAQLHFVQVGVETYWVIILFFICTDRRNMSLSQWTNKIYAGFTSLIASTLAHNVLMSDPNEVIMALIFISWHKR